MCSVPPLPIVKPCWCISLRIGCILLGIAQVLGGASNILFYVSGERILVDIQLPLGKYEMHILVHLLELITSIIVCTVGILGILAALIVSIWFSYVNKTPFKKHIRKEIEINYVRSIVTKVNKFQ